MTFDVITFGSAVIDIFVDTDIAGKKRFCMLSSWKQDSGKKYEI